MSWLQAFPVWLPADPHPTSSPGIRVIMLNSESSRAGMHHTQEGKFNLRSPHKSLAALAMVSMLNAGWVFTLGCATLCAFTLCPPRARQAPIEHCHQHASVPGQHSGLAQHSVPAQSNDGHDGTGCAHHCYSMARLFCRRPNVPSVIAAGALAGNRLGRGSLSSIAQIRASLRRHFFSFAAGVLDRPRRL